jgi:hypothetical protein
MREEKHTVEEWARIASKEEKLKYLKARAKIPRDVYDAYIKRKNLFENIGIMGLGAAIIIMLASLIFQNIFGVVLAIIILIVGACFLFIEPPIPELEEKKG